MPISVTSWFQSQLENKASEPRVVFTIGDSDYSNYVLRWPTIKRDWDDARAQKISITLANGDQVFNFFRQNKTTMQNTCALKTGFKHISSGDELISVFNGKVEKMSFSEGSVKLTIADKFAQLSDRVMGTNDAPVTFTDSTLPSDIAWTAITSYGGFSAVTSTSNPDIDYTSFLEWSAVFSIDAVWMNGHIKSLKVSEVLKRISRHTLSAIYIENDRFTFKRFTIVDSATLNLQQEILNITIDVDAADIVNRQYVYGSYVPDSDTWGVQVYNELTPSVNSYGVREEIEKDDAIWYVGSSSALNFAQRKTSTAGTPYDRVEVTTQLAPLTLRLGDNIFLTDSEFDISAGYRLMGYSIDLNNGTFKNRIDQSQYGTAFVLDVSYLDGPDILV